MSHVMKEEVDVNSRQYRHERSCGMHFAVMFAHRQLVEPRAGHIDWWLAGSRSLGEPFHVLDSLGVEHRPRHGVAAPMHRHHPREMGGSCCGLAAGGR